MKIEVLQNTTGDSGAFLVAGNFYDVKIATAGVLIRGGRAKLAETSLVKIKILYETHMPTCRHVGFVLSSCQDQENA